MRETRRRPPTARVLEGETLPDDHEPVITMLGRSLSPPSSDIAPRGGLRSRVNLRLALLLAGPLVLAIVAAYVYASGGRYVSTEDAYVRFDKVQVSSDIAGRVVEAGVRENEVVTRHQLLFRLDEEPYLIAVERAQSLLGQARAEVEALKASYRGKLAQLKAAQASADFMENEYRRQQKLIAENVASVSKHDEAVRNAEVARQQVVVMREDIAQAVANLGGDPSLATDEHPKVRQARAALEQAELDLRHTRIEAPLDGVIANAGVLRPGQYVQAGTPMFSLVEAGSLYIEANFKETDLTDLTVGQAATVTADAYPGRVWQATLGSIGPGTGSEYSVLPPQNAAGNWVKIVQRVPVRFKLAPGEGAGELRAGMSVVIEVDTGHRRGLPQLWTWFGHAP
jgi:membrane fusion protein (multidrug efflux system)